MTDNNNTFALDGLSASPARRKAEETVLFERRDNGSVAKHTQTQSTTTANKLDAMSAAGSSVPAQLQRKLNANQAKQRGWDIVAQARQDAKHTSRHKQRQAAQHAAHHHRQRHDVDNYAQAHTNQLQINTKQDQPARSGAAHVSSWLKLQNVFASRSFKLSAAGASLLAVVVVGVLMFAQQPDPVSSVESGQVHSAVDRQQSQPHHTTPAPAEPEGNQLVEEDDGDGNLNLWSSSLE